MYGELPSPCSGPKPNMGYGRRIDLATINRQSNIPDYNYDYDNMDGTIKKLTHSLDHLIISMSEQSFLQRCSITSAKALKSIMVCL